ncbi:MAG: hypothetical protein JNJ85_10365 [Candidatus Kapabacteria bacterium]|nr:hypothetical protein [Candidatus Kapabacteria bacterium]
MMLVCLPIIIQACSQVYITNISKPLDPIHYSTISNAYKIQCNDSVQVFGYLKEYYDESYKSSTYFLSQYQDNFNEVLSKGMTAPNPIKKYVIKTSNFKIYPIEVREGKYSTEYCRVSVHFIVVDSTNNETLTEFDALGDANIGTLVYGSINSSIRKAMNSSIEHATEYLKKGIIKF